MTDLSRLAAEWQEAKSAENAARNYRVNIEQQIIDITGMKKEEGSQTFKAGDHKITIITKINRTLDQAAWESIADTIPENLRPVKYAPKLELTGLRYLENNEPELYKIIAQAIIAKPAKPSVTIK